MGDGNRVGFDGSVDASQSDVSGPAHRLLLDSGRGSDPAAISFDQWRELNFAAAEITDGVARYVNMAMAYIARKPFEGQVPTVETLAAARQVLHSKYDGFTGMAARMAPEDPV